MGASLLALAKYIYSKCDGGEGNNRNVLLRVVEGKQ